MAGATDIMGLWGNQHVGDAKYNSTLINCTDESRT